MKLYMDTAYIAKCYVNEPGCEGVRSLAMEAVERVCSAWCLMEMACVFQRHVREGALTRVEASKLRKLFLDDVQDGNWRILPLSERLLRRAEAEISRLPAKTFLRAADALHLTAAQGAGFTEIWTNDRHLLAAAPHFGLTGRSV